VADGFDRTTRKAIEAFKLLIAIGLYLQPKPFNNLAILFEVGILGRKPAFVAL